jgi:sugar lactone lactonase YvrE
MILATGLAMGESPRWHDGRLWVSDMGARELVTVVPRSGDQSAPEIVAPVPGMPMGLGWRPDGTMLIVSSGDGTLLAGDATTVLADLSPLSDKPWSDMVVDGRGNAYIGNIGFDFPFGEVTTGILALVRPDGTVTQVADDLHFPNGIAVTPDNRTLILAETYAHRLTAYTIENDGRLSDRRVWAELPGAFPDGICLDAEGAVWFAEVPGKRCVRVREGGEVLQTVEADRGCFACVLGGADRRTLFIVTAEWGGAGAEMNARTGQVLAVDVDVPGAGWP